MKHLNAKLIELILCECSILVPLQTVENRDIIKVLNMSGLCNGYKVNSEFTAVFQNSSEFFKPTRTLRHEERVPYHLFRSYLSKEYVQEI